MTLNILLRPPRLSHLVQRQRQSQSQSQSQHHRLPQPTTIPNLLVRHASIRRDTNIDPKRDIIRRALYPPNVRNRPTPTGAWRYDTMRALRKAIPSAPAHETIERAFKLYIRHQRQRRAAELARKYECMRGAMLELERVEPRLAFEAGRVEDPRVRTAGEVALAKSTRVAEQKGADGRIRGLFPREMRAPMDTPSKDGWNYDWRPPSYWTG